MPAAGRGAFLRPGAPGAPPVLPPPRRAPARPAPGLGQVIHHAVAQAVQTTHPAVVAAQHIAHGSAPMAAVHQAVKAAGRVQHSAPPSPRVFPANVRKSGGSPLLDPGTLREALLEQAQEQAFKRGGLGAVGPATRRFEQQHLAPVESPEGGGGGILGAILSRPQLAIEKGWENILGNSGVPGAIGHVLGHTAADAISLGETPFIGALQGGIAAAQATKGNTRPAVNLAQSVASGFSHGALGELLLHGNPQGAAKAVAEHPLFSALEAEAGLGALERVPAKLTGREFYSRVRPSVALADESGLAGSGYTRDRTYSAVPHRAAIQMVLDRRRAPLLDAQGRPVTELNRGQVVPVLAPRSAREAKRLQERRANYESMRHVSGQRGARDVAQHAYVEANVGPGRVPLAFRRAEAGAGFRGHLPVKGAQATFGQAVDALARLHASGTLRTAETIPQDLTRRIEEIKGALADPSGRYRHTGEREAAEANLKTLEAMRADPRLMAVAAQVAARGERYGRALNAAEEAQPPGLHPDHRLERGRLSEWAIAHMGAEHKVQVTPTDKAAFEQAKAEHRTIVQERVKPAERRVQMETQALEKLKVKHQRDRGLVMRLSRGAVRTVPRQGEEKAARLLKLRDAKHELRQAQQAAREAQRAIPAKPKPRGALYAPDGHVLTHAEIEAHIRASGRDPATVAYLPHQVNPEQARKYYRQLRVEGRPQATSHERTGSLYKKGATDIEGHAVLHELTSKLTMAAGVENFDKIAQEAGMRHPAVAKARAGRDLTPADEKIVRRGGYFTGKEAAEAADRLLHDTGQEYIPVRAFGAALSQETKDAIRMAQSPQAAMETAHQGLLNDRFADPTDKTARNVVLMPAHQLQRLADQASVNSAKGLTRFAQMLNGPFRMAVLSQPRWLTGNFLEPMVMRLPLEGSGVILPGAALDMRAASKLLKSLDRQDPKTANDLRAIYLAGRFIGGKGQAIRRTWQDMTPGSRAEAIAHAGSVVRHLPVVKQLGDLVLAWPKSFFFVNRHLIENPTAMMALGKTFRRDIKTMTGSWIQTARLGQQAVDEAARGLIDTPTQHRYVEAYHEILGQYDGFNPALKRLVQSYTPFLPWTLASMRFVYWTLPAHHTLAFTAMLKAAQSVMPEWEAMHRDTPPGTLRDALRARDGGYVDIAHYFPYGATIPFAQIPGQKAQLKDLTEPLTNPIAPQVSGILKYLEGRDPFGRDLQFSGGKEPSLGEQLTGLGEQTAETFAPIISTLRRLQEGGGTAYANSSIFAPKVKPGTSHQGAVNRTLNPFRETYLKQPSSSSSAGAASLSSLPPSQRHEVEQAEAQARAYERSPVVQAEIKRAEEEAERAASR